ncbi:MAG: hypothetical protein HUJ65_05830 [Oscillospiraceae bacterium]|nr:hypothetical protein [Oscillospiraceae bacterium]
METLETERNYFGIKAVNERLDEMVKLIPSCKTRLQALPYLADATYCWMRYHATFDDFFRYRLYRLSLKARKEYIFDYTIYDELVPRMNTAEELLLIEDKSKFEERYPDLIGRDFCGINSDNFENFEAFFAKHPMFIRKPVNNFGGFGIEKVDGTGKTAREVFDELLKNGDCIVEELLVQHEDMATLNPDSVNTIRVVTMKDERGTVHMPFAALRVGRKGSVVDSVLSGGLVGQVDIESGQVTSEFYDKNGSPYFRHPDTGMLLVGFQIPYWEDVMKAVYDSAHGLPKIRLVGWDVMIRHDGHICVMEANSAPECSSHQMCAHRGLKEIYQNYLGKIK